MPSLRNAAMLSLVGAAIAGCGEASADRARPARSVELLNVSYDPTRELWRDLNTRFAARYERDTGNVVTIRQSHGGSATQARAVIDGLDADVVTLATWSDTDAIQRKGLIAPGWEERLPYRSLPYTSTIVFVVRKGNPKRIRDWRDLIQSGIEVVTPNPKTSGNGKLAFLAAWGSVTVRGGSDAQARDFVAALYRHTPVLDTGARGSSATFAQKRIGDVHLTWENEAHLEVRESGGELELVYPPISIRAEPHVAVVDANAERKGTAAVARAYLEYLYTDEAQEVIAAHFYRPIQSATLARYSGVFPEIRLFGIGDIAESWDAAQQRFLAEGALFDAIYTFGAK